MTKVTESILFSSLISELSYFDLTGQVVSVLVGQCFFEDLFVTI